MTFCGSGSACVGGGDGCAARRRFWACQSSINATIGAHPDYDWTGLTWGDLKALLARVEEAASAAPTAKVGHVVLIRWPGGNFELNDGYVHDEEEARVEVARARKLTEVGPVTDRPSVLLATLVVPVVDINKEG